MNEKAKLFWEIGEPLAAGFFECYEQRSLPLIYCRGYRRYFETCPIVYSPGIPVYPFGDTTSPYVPAEMPLSDKVEKLCVYPLYALVYEVNWAGLEKKSPEAARLMREFEKDFHYAGGWNHSMLNFKRMLAEGIDRYEQRLLAKDKSDFRDGLLDMIEGMRVFHRRSLAALPQMGAPQELIDALQKVPYAPAETAYEAVVSLNYGLFFDGFDNIGRVDSILEPYYKGEDMREWLHAMFENMQTNVRWSITLGPDYNDITRQALEATRGLARPLTELRVVEGMPEDIWELAGKRILEGGGQPAFYNDRLIRERLMGRIPHLPLEDAMEFAGGGCTETSFAGYTYSGGTDDNINVLLIFEKYMYERLPLCESFEQFYEEFFPVMLAELDAMMAQINANWNERARCCFSPIRSLFIDDCIDNETGWFQGGARYTFAIHADSGMPNVIDSMLAIRDLIYDKKRYTPEEFLTLLKAEDPEFFAALKNCPAYGVGNKDADALAKDITTRFYARCLDAKLDLGLGFFPTAHQYDRHIGAGAVVGPTPDGRKAGQPTADSLAAVNGKAVKGPTVMLQGAACYEQKDIYGMPVTNLSITRKYSPQVIRALVEGYFAMGGTQLQITVTDRETLEAARRDPDSYRDLIVRVGGYSEFFCNLTPALRDAVIARTLFD